MRRGLNLSSVLNRSSFPRRKIGHGFENYIGSLFSSSKRHIEKEVMPMIIRLSIPTADDLEDVGALLAVISHPPDALFLDGGA